MALETIHKEKRHFNRVICRVVGHVRGLNRGHDSKTILEVVDNPVPLQVDNLSMGGAHLRTDHPSQEGEVIRLELDLEGKNQIVTAMAEVCWSKESGFGVRFLALPEHDRARLSRYLLRPPKGQS